MGNAGQHGQSFIFNGRLSLSIGILEDLAAAGAGIVGVIASVPISRLHRLGFGHIVAKRGQSFGFCRGCRLAVFVLECLIAHGAGVVGVVSACCAGGFYPLGFGHGVPKSRKNHTGFIHALGEVFVDKVFAADKAAPVFQITCLRTAGRFSGNMLHIVGMGGGIVDGCIR